MTATSCGRGVSLWAVVVTAHNGSTWATMVNSSFTDCDKRATMLEGQGHSGPKVKDRTYAVVPAQYDTGDFDEVFKKAAIHPNSCEEALELVPCLQTT